MKAMFEIVQESRFSIAILGQRNVCRVRPDLSAVIGRIVSRVHITVKLISIGYAADKKIGE